MNDERVWRLALCYLTGLDCTPVRIVQGLAIAAHSNTPEAQWLVHTMKDVVYAKDYRSRLEKAGKTLLLEVFDREAMRDRQVALFNELATLRLKELQQRAAIGDLAALSLLYPMGPSARPIPLSEDVCSIMRLYAHLRRYDDVGDNAIFLYYMAKDTISNSKLFNVRRVRDMHEQWNKAASDASVTAYLCLKPILRRDVTRLICQSVWNDRWRGEYALKPYVDVCPAFDVTKMAVIGANKMIPFMTTIMTFFAVIFTLFFIVTYATETHDVVFWLDGVRYLATIWFVLAVKKYGFNRFTLVISWILMCFSMYVGSLVYNVFYMSLSIIFLVAVPVETEREAPIRFFLGAFIITLALLLWVFK